MKINENDILKKYINLFNQNEIDQIRDMTNNILISMKNIESYKLKLEDEPFFTLKKSARANIEE